MTIWKYPVLAGGVFVHTMPTGAMVLCAKVQGTAGLPQMWVLVDPERTPVRRVFRVVGTGHDIDSAEADRLAYVDTFMLEDGNLVFHLFERHEESQSRRVGEEP